MYKQSRGVSVIEVMIGLVIFSIAFIFIFNTLTVFFNSQKTALQSIQALYLAEEGQEALRFLRDENWNTLSSIPKNTSYALSVSTSTMSIGAGAETVGEFTRRVYVREARRNTQNDFVETTGSGTSVDPDTLRLTVQVTWGDSNTVELHSLLTNLHDR